MNVLTLEQMPRYRVEHKDAREARMVLFRQLRRQRVRLIGFEKLARTYARHGRGRRLTMSVHEAIAILGANRAGYGLGRLVKAAPACAA